ncbi:MAG TPA: AsmA family protein, partial [Burkholderiales bacterium]|nr:AsmA family protein [Burkholderiales bacterium]
MNKLRYVAIGAAVVVLMLVGAAAYLAATFDPNAYKPQIIQLVKEKTGRTLRLDGDLKLAFWPSIGAEAGRMSLSEPNSEREFAAMESARVSLKLLPLLSRQYIVDEVSIRGLRATIIRAKAGATNIDDLVGKKEETAPAEKRPVVFDIARVDLDNAAVEYRDDTTGARYALSGLTLKTGRIAPDVPTKIAVKTAARSNKPALDLVLDGKTRLTFNLERQRYKLDELALEVKGQAAGYTGISAKASGQVSADLQAGQYTADKLAASGSGMRGKEKTDFKLDAPSIALTADKASGDKVVVALTMAAPDATTTLNATLPGIEGTAKSFRSAAMTLDLERKQPNQTVKARIASPLTGSVDAKQVSLP